MYVLALEIRARLFLILYLFVDSSDQTDYYVRLKLNTSSFCILMSLGPNDNSSNDNNNLFLLTFP